MNTSLDALHPIYIPPEVGFFPLSEGYILLSISILSLLISYSALTIQNYLQNRFKREAKKELKSFKASLSAYKVFELLKRVALSCNKREDIASLSGDDLLKYFNINENELFIKASQSAYDKNIIFTKEEKSKLYDLTLQCINEVKYVRT